MLDALFAFFLLLQLADFWTTREILKRGGYERNPLVNVSEEDPHQAMARLGLQIVTPESL